MGHYYIKLKDDRDFMQLDVLRKTTIEVLDILDFTKELIRGKDIYYFYRENRGKFINISAWHTIENQVMCDVLKYKYGDIHYTNDLSITHNSDKFRFKRLLHTSSILVIKNGYPIEVLERPLFTSCMFEPKYLDIRDGSLIFTVCDDITVVIGNRGVSLESQYKLTDLDSALRSLYIKWARGLNVVGSTDVELISALRDLTDLVSIREEIGATWVNALLKVIDLNKVSTKVLADLVNLASKYCNREVQSQVARSMFLRKG